MTAPLKRFEPLIEVLQEIRKELRELRAVSIALTAISDTLEEK